MGTIRNNIIKICKELHLRGWIASCDGNVSYKKSDNSIYITPKGVHKGYLEISQMSKITLSGNIIYGKPSTERLMHLAIYKNSVRAKAIVHAHPPYATAWSIAHPELEFLPINCLSEGILAIGSIPMISYARPGSQEMGTNLLPYLEKSQVYILKNHGAISWGENLQEAYNGMERLEHLAKILFFSTQLGGMYELPHEELDFLWKKRKDGDQRIY